MNRVWAFRFLAVAIGLSPLVLLEVALVLAGLGKPELHPDPYVGFRSVQPLFVLNDAGDRYEIPEVRHSHFRPDGFDAQKDEREFRIFCLGGSTVQGSPYSNETSFTKWLELTLNAADPSHRWRVVNCGGISYASYRLIPILQETLEHRPDMFIIYTGHNEFLEERTYRRLKHAPYWQARIEEFAGRTRTFHMMRSLADRLQARSDTEFKPANVLATEVEALLDYQGGLEDYRRDPQWRQGVIEHFEQNVLRMVRMAQSAGVPTMLINPVSNLRCCPPFKTEHSEDLSDDDKQRWYELWEKARGLYREDLHAAIEILEDAMALDDQHAGLHYDLGNCLVSLGRYEDGEQAFLRAKDLDVCPLRILQPMHERLMDVFERTGVAWVDAHALIEERSLAGIPGSDWLVDHVHPTIEGHQLLAEAIFLEMVRLRIASATDGWSSMRDRAFQEHSATLDALYYLRGEKRLLGQKAWAEGRVQDQRPNAPLAGRSP